MNDNEAEVWLYDEVGHFGITAADFTREVGALDVSTINLRINSPGGSVFDGITIHNVLRRHRAKVHTTVDGIAASIASVIALAGDTITMGRGTEMMIHNPSGMVLGQADDMREMADVLDRIGRDLAGIYQARAGGTLGDWLDRMAAETFYSAQEAVDAGLADSVLGAQQSAAIAAKWTGRRDAELLGDWHAWNADYTERVDAQARRGDPDAKPAPREVRVTPLADGRERRDIGNGLTVIAPAGRRREPSRSDAVKARHAARYVPGRQHRVRGLSAAELAARSAAVRQRHEARRRNRSQDARQRHTVRLLAARAAERRHVHGRGDTPWLVLR
jgi:ATP-dependent protease ClpP protease subunit